LDVHVHTDRRACITAPILKSFADMAGCDELPKRVFVTRVPEGIELRWHQTTGAKSYDLSIRDRVLVGGFIPGETLTVKSLDGVALTLATSKGMAIANATASKPKPATTSSTATPKVAAPKPKKKSPKKSVPKVSVPKRPKQHKDQPMSQPQTLTDLIFPGLCVDARQNHGSMPLLEIARALDSVSPGVTLGDFIEADSRVIIDFASVLTAAPKAPSKKKAAHSVPKTAAPKTSAPKVAKKPAAKTASSAPPASNDVEETAKHVLAVLAKAKKDGRTNLSVHEFGPKSRIQFLRGVLNALLKKGKITKIGNTRATRYNLA
jgi:hypothetical protein